ncbi:MAG TPA: UDP-N-acetylglucosamine--N-acetylmuramyl-(pentapeptide) pyrophosphoryl-undecaprenol N-acetylglucosamine transferase, partial [Bacteroidales bacterium]|nr:UDP-N-acetylglucosamine--N-acetylmuramyl-(pentapeptide) pyrophosphoryl-undecaprenol N-acetylglucosamine transferase [Bacteroidales bacterium]
YLNAQALADNDAIILLDENLLDSKGKEMIIDLINNDSLQKKLSENISKFHNPNAMDNIIELIEKYLKN